MINILAAEAQSVLSRPLATFTKNRPVMTADLNRFISAQESTYSVALQEIREGRKRSHWMWFIFPQVSGLGSSSMSEKYSIKDLHEAKAYLNHPVLGTRLIEISKVLCDLPVKDAHRIFGSPDDLKLKSSMTLFAVIENADPVFQKVLDAFFKGKKDEKTLAILKT